MSSASIDTVGRVGTIVRDARKQRGLTQAQLAEHAHVSRVFVIELESGHPRAELGKALAVLDVLGANPFADLSGAEAEGA
ncbi:MULTISPECIES: helix-turn-helix domain-containing protein [Arthrobacter]|uniref:Helix-turn-helix domain-containing protein n=2 Tax=Arthrobacter TaxID=1663 RepID=A0ABU9KQI7_9MICC|nr:helix-turn-helix domain-containing protein [Arthrobacter sp. YJM1]MDP5227957.1 helix-turn-helix domain-containing protein [Arthrobacter sp. YJM1]